MTKHLDRLMSRASVTAMAAFAPKPEPASTIPAFAERVDESPPAETGRTNGIDGLTAEEQAEIDAMREDAGAAPDNVDHSADDAPSDGDGDGDSGDDEPHDDPPAPGDAEPAPLAADGKRPPPKTISYGRYQKELAKAQKDRDDLQARLDGAVAETTKEREARLRLDERTNLLLEAIKKPAPAAAAAAPAADADPEPDEGDDPIGHAQWEIRSLKKTVNDLKNGRDQDVQTRQAVDADEQVLNTATAEISTAAQAAPEIAEAFVHYRESRYTELGYAYAGIDINDPAQCATLSAQQRSDLTNKLQNDFRNDCLVIAKNAKLAGRPLVNDVMSYAKARGYKPGAEAPAAARSDGAGDTPPARNGNGAPPAAPARSKEAPTVKEQLGAVRQNLEDSRSLSDAGGSPGGQLSVKQLGEMPDREFQQLYDSLKESGQLDKMMGRPDNM